eukprot:s50_g72.t1
MSQRSRGEINLAEAARAQEVHHVAERLAAGDDVNMQDSQGNTALHWACLLGLHGLTSLLLAHDARTDIPNHNGSYAVHAAAAGKNIKAMKMLTGDKNMHTSKDVLFQQDKKGYTPFLIAAENNDVFTMEWLYFQGVSLEERGANGESAAQITSRLGHTRGLQWLISHHASVFERDNDGRNAFHLACSHGRHDSIKMLLDSTETTKSLQCVDTLGDGPISLAWKHGQLHVFCWLWFMEFAEALADTLSLKSYLRAALSRSAWTTVFWTLLLLNFLTFSLALLEPAGTEAMLWLAMLSCAVCCWWHLSTSDPGFTGPRFAFANQEQDPELDRFSELVQLPMERQVEELTRLCGWSSPKATATQRATDRIDRMGAESSPWAALWSGSSKEAEDEVAPKLASRCGDPAPSGTSRSSRTFRRSDEDEWDEEQNHSTRPVATVQQRWLRLSRRQQLCRALLEKYDVASLRQHAEGQQAERGKEAARLRQVEKELTLKASKLMDEAGAARFKEISAQSGEYARLALEGEFRTLCVICRRVRAMRSFHCKLCGCCVQRMDHHCPWVDRCIGLENQRSFYVFLILLALVFMVFLQMSINFLAEALLDLAAGSGDNGG